MAGGGDGEQRLGTGDLALFALLIGVVTTCVFYRYGVDNHVAELPIVLRAIDPGFLAGDFYTDAASAFGPRSHFASAIAALTSKDALPVAYFWLTAACNVAIALITALTARDLFGGSGLAGMTAAGLVMSVATFKLGYTDRVFASQLLTSRAVLPLLLLSLWAALGQRAALCVLAAGAAAWLHPTFGLEGGALALLVLALAGDPPRPRALALAAIAYGGWAALLLIPYLAQPIPDSASFLAIETHFRHPHHNLPGSFPAGDWLAALGFCLAGALAFHSWRARPAAPPALARAIAGLAAALFLACLAGFLFVERVPTLLLAVARPFRLLILAKWLGLVLIGGLAARAWQPREGEPVGVDPRVLLGSALSPLTLALAQVTGLGVTRLSSPRLRALLAGPLPAIASFAVLALVDRPSAGSLLCFLAFLFAVLLFANTRTPAWPRAVCAGAAAALLAHVFWGAALPRAVATATSRLRPSFSLAQLEGPEIEVARWARAHTAPGTVFLTPPDFGLFRLVAERPIVVDFKAFPFQSPAMLEWRQRLEDVYGPTSAAGWAALDALRAAYGGVEAAALARARERYGAVLAVVPRTARARLPVVFENGDYRVLDLRQGPQQPGRAGQKVGLGADLPISAGAAAGSSTASRHSSSPSAAST